ncbi:MAG: hypothetical protein ACRD3O_02320 [Terriglobia bacterium]
MLLLLGASGVAGSGPGHFEIVTGKLLNKSIPRDVYLEGSAIPVEKRNAVLIKIPAGARALFALIVTAGFASQLQQKYSGMLISEGRLSLCGKDAGIGSYGFGIRRPSTSKRQQAQFFLYNQAGDQVIACDMKKDLRMRHPAALQVVIESWRLARLYLGRYWVELGP